MRFILEIDDAELAEELEAHEQNSSYEGMLEEILTDANFMSARISPIEKGGFVKA